MCNRDIPISRSPSLPVTNSLPRSSLTRSSNSSICFRIIKRKGKLADRARRRIELSPRKCHVRQGERGSRIAKQNRATRIYRRQGSTGEKDRARDTGRCRTSWMFLTCWLVCRGVTCVARDVTQHTRCGWSAPLAAGWPGRRPSCSGVLANGLYRRRARDWDPGFRMRARSQESSTQAPRTRRLSLPDAPTRLVSLCLPYSLPAGAVLLLTCRVADTGVTYPLVCTYPCLPLPAWLPAYLSPTLPYLACLCRHLDVSQKERACYK